MKQKLVLRVLAEAMGWTEEETKSECDWLRLMARLKYDTYQGYQAGVRFIESLVVWVQQFPQNERKIAYDLIRRRMIFVSANELRHLIEQVYPREVQPYLIGRASKQFGIAPYLVWSNPDARAWIEKARRRVLFMGLSDGARTDVLRRANVSRISNEQTVLAPVVDHDKWRDLQAELRKEHDGKDDPKFDCVWVLDDLTASGTTLLRCKDSKWKGKLWKLRNAIWLARKVLTTEFPLAEQFDLRVHHYLATQEALDEAKARSQQAHQEFGAAGWFGSVQFSYGMLLSNAVKLKQPGDSFVDLAQRYYDASIEDRHSEESGQKDVRMGYKGCALPLILEHNTPNNGVALLWADTDGANGAHRMRPLFRRRTRHHA